LRKNTTVKWVTILLIKQLTITIPVLVVHDNQDYEVPVKGNSYLPTSF
jgi:hypothetical protein